MTLYNIALTSMQRHYIYTPSHWRRFNIMTLIQRRINVNATLGQFYNVVLTPMQSHDLYERHGPAGY